jgi:D-glycero-D-manno-heptose 1,7-bisphosphate phosphatase
VRFHRAGYRVAVVTNQAGIGRGVVTQEAVDALHARLRAEVQLAGGDIDAVLVCPHHWDAGCACRKPRPGLLFQAQREFHLDLTRTWFLGDDERDAQAAEAAGCLFSMVSERTPLASYARAWAAAKETPSCVSS